MAISDKLQQIDHALIQLLSERIAILSTTTAPAIEEQLSNCEDWLAQAGLPARTWQSVVTSCMAALVQAPAVLHSAQSHRITVVGGRGLMGQFFSDRLRTMGHSVSVLEYDGWAEADRLLGQADLVLICVPLKATLGVIRRVAPYLSATTLLADIASTKATIVEAMLESHAGPVMGLHPLFGPGVASFLAQKVAVCPGRQPEAFQWLLDGIAADGGTLIPCTPQEHDLMMITVQAIRHFTTFSLGVFLAEEGIAIDRTLEFASPIYRTEINLISRLFAQAGDLSMDIMLAAPDRPEAIQRLVQTCDRLAQYLAQGDRSALLAEFETARESFREESPRALQESNHVINSLSTFLAASAMATARQTPPSPLPLPLRLGR